MNVAFFRQHAHALLGISLLTGFTTVAASLYLEVPAIWRQHRATPVEAQGHPCPKHSSETAAAKPAEPCAEHASMDQCAHGEGAGCCKGQKTAPMTLPPGHPPIAGFTVATEPPVK